MIERTGFPLIRASFIARVNASKRQTQTDRDREETVPQNAA